MFQSTRPTAILDWCNEMRWKANTCTHLWLSKSATTVPVHFDPTPSSSVSASSAGLTRQILTWPSRLPVAIRWYDRPHEGAHATEVTAYGAGASFSKAGAPAKPLPSAEDLPDGEGSSVSSVIGRRDGEIWMICANQP